MTLGLSAFGRDADDAGKATDSSDDGSKRCRRSRFLWRRDQKNGGSSNVPSLWYILPRVSRFWLVPTLSKTRVPKVPISYENGVHGTDARAAVAVSVFIRSAKLVLEVWVLAPSVVEVACPAAVAFVAKFAGIGVVFGVEQFVRCPRTTQAFFEAPVVRASHVCCWCPNRIGSG